MTGNEPTAPVGLVARANGWLDDARARWRPPPPNRAVARLRALILVTAAAVVVVEAVNLQTARELGYSLTIRTCWALARVLGFLVLLRAVRFGRATARPFGLILAVTTVFAVARLTQPRDGDMLPELDVVIGFVVLTVLCGAIVYLLYRSRSIAAHLEHRPMRRHVPAWVLTARVAVLAYSALVSVPLLVAVGTLFHGQRPHPLLPTAALIGLWITLFLVCVLVLPLGSSFIVFGHRWARWLTGIVSVLVLVAQPLLCYLTLGIDGLLRDGVPLVITALLALVALRRSRGLPTWVRGAPTPGEHHPA